MTIRMLIEATHAEETRVVVADGNRLEEYDYETSTKKQLKGNIYLAKVTRVEPSLQAAFIEYGGNRHGFLAFNEIHPDYYRIPIEDREALLAEAYAVDGDDAETDDAASNGEQVETLGGDETEDIHRRGAAQRQRARSRARQYKIQEVIKRRQVLLVQVVKEERGNKGAALTTYLSLAGRYCVLMPNTARGGGISRKITNLAHRKRLKSILGDLGTPPGMAMILRTAGVERTKPEIKRDYEYLRRLWDEIRALTLKSSAPALIYEEANVVKRSLRDLYTREIEEVLIDGDEAYKAAKHIMKTMIPSHAKRVQKYEDPSIPLFHRFQIESQLDEIHDQVVNLRSGGYIVINPTEALVSIDVNSGRSTRERNIEQTALRTNLEAATEVARQLRLRDLSGLIVIDFIDMDESRNNSAVERRLKEAMKSDRARLQVGRISAFGLLELSRQRLRPSLIEASTQPCPSCGGTGTIRSTESTALRVLRAIEEEGIKHPSQQINVQVPPAVALYVLNQKREALIRIEARHALLVFVGADDTLVPPAFAIERVRELEAVRSDAVVRQAGLAAEPVEDEAEEAIGDASGDASEEGTEALAEDRGRRRRRSRRRPSDDLVADAGAEPIAALAGPRGDGPGANDADGADDSAGDAADAKVGRSDQDPAEDGAEAPRRRRGRRGGRCRARRGDAATPETALADGAPEQSPISEPSESEPPAATLAEDAAAAVAPDDLSGEAAAEASPEVEPKAPRRRRRRPSRAAEAAAESADDGAPAPAEPPTEATAEPAGESVAASAIDDGVEAEPAKPRRRRPPRRRTSAPAADEPTADGPTAGHTAGLGAATSSGADATPEQADAAASDALQTPSPASQGPATAWRGAQQTPAEDGTPSAGAEDTSESPRSIGSPAPSDQSHRVDARRSNGEDEEDGQEVLPEGGRRRGWWERLTS